MIYPKTPARISRLSPQTTTDELRKRASSGNWRNRFLKAHRNHNGGRGSRLRKGDEFIPECYNYAWGYF